MRVCLRLDRGSVADTSVARYMKKQVCEVVGHEQCLRRLQRVRLYLSCDGVGDEVVALNDVPFQRGTRPGLIILCDTSREHSCQLRSQSDWRRDKAEYS
jgi:hypothetical protein